MNSVVDAVIEPDISTIGPLDFKKIDVAVEAGRLATRAMLEAQPHLLGATADPQVANMI